SLRLKRALRLARCAGMRIRDIVSGTWSCWDGEHLTFRQSKTGLIVSIHAPAPLRDELRNTPREGENILVNERGDAYTRDGLQTNLWKVVKALVAEASSSGASVFTAFAIL